MSDRGEAAAMQCLLALEAMAARVRALEAIVLASQAAASARMPKEKRNPHGASDAQMELARRMRAEGHKIGMIFEALNAVPGGKRFRDVVAAKNFVNNAKMPLGKGAAAVEAGQAARTDGTIPPSAAKPAVAAEPGLPVASAILNGDLAMLRRAALPNPLNGEAQWVDCVRYCRYYDLPPFDGDMLRINRHLEKRGKKPWVLVKLAPPPRPTPPDGRAPA